MLRYLAAAGSALLLIAAGFFIWRIQAQPDGVPAPPAETEESALEEGDSGGRPSRPPAASEKTKEQRRFDRADRDNDGRITRDELLQPRRKAFEKLDSNRNGNLSFEEWAARTVTKFGTADSNRDGALNRAEYATTAPKARPKAKNCAC